MVLTVSADEVTIKSLFVENLSQEESGEIVLIDHAELRNECWVKLLWFNWKILHMLRNQEVEFFVIYFVEAPWL